MSHYDYASAWLSKELGIKSSNGMKNIYRKIQNYNEENGEADINSIDAKLQEELEKGAKYCDIDYFKLMYNLSKRKNERQESSDYIGLATITSTGNENSMQMSEVMNVLKDACKDSLRKNDLCSCWNDNQLIFILSNPSEEYLEPIKERIVYKFLRKIIDESFHLKIKFRPIANKNNINL